MGNIILGLLLVLGGLTLLLHLAIPGVVFGILALLAGLLVIVGK